MKITEPLCNACSRHCKKKIGDNYGSCINHSSGNQHSDRDSFYQHVPSLRTQAAYYANESKLIPLLVQFAKSGEIQDYWKNNFYLFLDEKLVNSPIIESYWRNKIKKENLAKEQKVQPLSWVNTSDKLPTPYSYDSTCAPYYLVKTEKFGYVLAMFLKDENGECNWYSSYMNKIINPVVKWQYLEE